jgi:ABC-type polysaccharide/polyol phosphate export permease
MCPLHFRSVTTGGHQALDAARTDTAVAPEWVENRPTRGGRALDGRELWQYRELARFFALRDLKVRYKQAAFGVGWAILRPIAGAIVLTVVFRQVAGVASDGLPYVPFALVGYSAWAYFSTSLGGAAGSLVANSALITKVYFPRLLAPAAAVVPGLVDLAVAMVPLVAVMAWTGTAPGPQVVTLPLWVAALALTALGIGLWFATVNVRYRDAGALLGLLMQLWFFLSPIAYPASEVPEAWRPLYYLNPIAGIVGGLRWSLLDGPWPGWPLALSAAVAVAVTAAGLRTFRSGERYFADVI